MTEGFYDFFQQHDVNWKWRTANDFRNRSLLDALEDLKPKR